MAIHIDTVLHGIVRSIVCSQKVADFCERYVMALARCLAAIPVASSFIILSFLGLSMRLLAITDPTLGNLSMFDKTAISRRFFSYYPDQSRRDLAKLFGVGKSAVIEWAQKGTVPWSKLKYLSDSQAISWDWLIEGMEPQESLKEKTTPASTSPNFDRAGINQRFLSLFPKMTLTQIATVLNVTSGAVSGWNRNFSQVSWERLNSAVRTFGVRWDWLIDGLEPKYR